MPVPTHVFDPPFNIVRSSHAVLDVVDLKASSAFYENTVGLHVEDRDDQSVYLRGSEEHQHHSLVLRKAATAACNRLGFKVGNEGDLKHVDNFLECVRTRQQPNCHADLGYRTLIATDLSVRSYRNGKMYYFDPDKELVVEH